MAITAVAQRVSAHQASGTGFTTSAFTAGATGNFLVVVLALAGATTTSNMQTPTDNGTGSAWQMDVNLASQSGVHNGIMVASTIIGATPPTTITFSWTTAAASAVKVFEFAGVASSAWLDVAGTPKTQASGTAASANTITPAVTGELIIGGFAVNSAQSTFTAGTNYTSWGAPTNTATPDICCEYNLNGTTSETNGGTYAASVATTSEGVLVAYKQAPAPVLTPVAVHLQAVNRAASY